MTEYVNVTLDVALTLAVIVDDTGALAVLELDCVMVAVAVKVTVVVLVDVTDCVGVTVLETVAVDVGDACEYTITQHTNRSKKCDT